MIAKCRRTKTTDRKYPFGSVYCLFIIRTPDSVLTQRIAAIGVRARERDGYVLTAKRARVCELTLLTANRLRRQRYGGCVPVCVCDRPYMRMGIFRFRWANRLH